MLHYCLYYRKAVNWTIGQTFYKLELHRAGSPPSQGRTLANKCRADWRGIVIWKFIILQNTGCNIKCSPAHVSCQEVVAGLEKRETIDIKLRHFLILLLLCFFQFSQKFWAFSLFQLSLFLSCNLIVSDKLFIQNLCIGHH